jgi:phosphonate transport system permease protein
MTTAEQSIARQAASARERDDLLRTWPKVNLRLILIIVAGAIIYYWAVQGTQASPRELVDGIPNIVRFIKKMFPPVWETETKTLQTPAVPLPYGAEIPRLGFANVEFELPSIIYAIVQTVQIAIIGTTLSLFLTIPFALLAARNIAPFRVIYQTTRLLLNANRAIPEIIFALIFVVAVGLGPFAGVLALAVGSIGFSAKIWAEAIEAIDPQQVLAVRATGATRLQTVMTAVMPQAMPLIASYSLLSFEHNVRAATILGLVGGGGVGFQLQKYLALFQYQKLTGALILIIIVVTAIDRISDRLRKKLT